MDKDTAILITGATGFIGSYVLRTLIKEGYKNLTAIHRSSSDFSLVREIKNEINWVCCDILDVPGLEGALSKKEVVIHAAALVSFDPRDREKLNRVNIRGTANIVNVALAMRVIRFIHISSVGVFPRRKIGEVIDENVDWSDSKLNTDYAISKYQAELEIWRGAAEGLSVTILNPSLVIGSGFWQSGSASIFGQVYQGLRFYPEGSTGVVDVRDVAQAVCRSLQNAVAGERIIISGENMSYQAILDLIADQFGKKRPSIRLNRWLREIALIKYFLTSLTGRRAKVLTRASLKNAQHKWSFDHHKSLEMLEMKYRPIATCISETCQLFLKANQVGLPPTSLPL